MAPSLPPFQFRTCRKGLSDWDQTPGPPQHPPFPAQFWLGCQTGTGISCLPPPPQALTLFFFSKSFSIWSWTRKMGREGV